MSAVDDIRWALRRLIVIVIVCAAYLVVIVQRNACQPDDASAMIFFRLFCQGEPIPVGLLALFSAILWWSLSRSPRASSPPTDASTMSVAALGVVSAAVAALVAAVAVWLMKNSAFSMDEFGAVFQARLFASGRVAADVPSPWKEHLDAVTPVFILSRPADAAWVSAYLPGNAAIRAPFERAGLGWSSGVILATVCILALGGIARRLWPNQSERQLVAVLALALSTQFLVVAGTPYAMTAHLAVNLCWLYVWVRGGRVAYLAGPIGMFGVLLHQPVPHLLFAAPFGLRLLFQRRWPLVAWMGVWYLMALAFAAGWHTLVGFNAATGGLAAAFAAPTFTSLFVAVMHATLLLTWQTPLAAVALVVCLRRARSLRPIEQDLLGGLVFSLAFYLCFKLVTQGHGWGWRYGHQVLGNVALLAAVAWPTFVNALGRPRALQLAFVSAALTIVCQFPLRARLVQNTVTPFANALHWLRAQDADIVIVPNDSIWYGRDLVRNDPGLVRPVLVFGTYGTGSANASAPLPTVARVRRIGVAELTAFGLEAVNAAQPPASQRAR